MKGIVVRNIMALVLLILVTTVAYPKAGEAYTLTDAVAVFKMLSDSSSIAGVGDLDANGKIDLVEAIYILQALAGWRTVCEIYAGPDVSIYEENALILCGETTDCGQELGWSHDAGDAIEIQSADIACGAGFIAPATNAEQTVVFSLSAGDDIEDTAAVRILPALPACETLIVGGQTVNLSDPDVKSVHDALQTADPVHAYPIFVRDATGFMEWIDMGVTLTTAVHETNHGLDGDLTYCGDYKTKYLFLGSVFRTDFDIFTDTANYSIVEETIDPALKECDRYDLYIEGSKPYNGNDFTVLLDELTAYTGDGWFQLKYSESGLPAETGTYKMPQFQIDGVVNFMVYLEYYLKSSRLNYPGTYSAIVDSSEMRGYVQYVWTRAEKLLIESYRVIMADYAARYIFFEADAADGLDHLKAAYSAELLNELDRLDIRHLTESAWMDNYYTYGKRKGGSGKQMILRRGCFGGFEANVFQLNR